ncbi:MAG: hypothetical protein IJU66_03600 [Oscillospiraceae bacterium]|nr:hypothetical protein [Oscillospiraceae bacterium]
MKKMLRKAILWLGGAVIFALAVPAGVLSAMIWELSRLVDRAVGTGTA